MVKSLKNTPCRKEKNIVSQGVKYIWRGSRFCNTIMENKVRKLTFHFINVAGIEAYKINLT